MEILRISTILQNNPTLTEEKLSESIYITRTGAKHIRLYNNKPHLASHPGIMDNTQIKYL